MCDRPHRQYHSTLTREKFCGSLQPRFTQMEPTRKFTDSVAIPIHSHTYAALNHKIISFQRTYHWSTESWERMASQMGGTDALGEATIHLQYSGRHQHQHTTTFLCWKSRVDSGYYYIQIRLARFEVLRAVLMTIKARWNVTLCRFGDS
jgi:hypothetical protein